MVLSSKISAQCSEPVSSPSNRPNPPPTAKPDNARKELTRTCAHNSPDALSSKNDFTTALGAGKKRLGSRLTDDAHCHTINKAMGMAQGSARITRALGQSRGLMAT